MFKALKQWLGFGGKKETKNEDNLAVCLQSLAKVPAASLKDKIIVVCKGPDLKLRKDGALPDRLNSGEVCWILPGGDVRLPIDFQYENQEIHAVVVLRFEGDRNFALHAANILASGRSGITKADLARFVAGQWSELLSLQKIQPQQLASRNSETLARFRTHLSLLLQENGFRCVGIESIEMPTTKTPKAKTTALPETVSQEIHTAVKKATTERGWDHLLDQLDDAGFEPCEADIEKLETLGDDYRSRKVTAEDASLQIRKMIERNNLEISRITEQVARWNAAEVKFRLLDALDDKPEEYLLATAESLDKPNKVPSTWYMLRRHKVDEKLQKYLKNAAKNLKKLLDSAMRRQPNLENKAKLTPAQSVLKRFADKLDMTPNLRAGTGNLRSHQRNIVELVKAVRRSVTASQIAEGLLRGLVSEDYPKDQYLATVADLESALATLEREINDRKNVYGV